ncbi:Pro-kumamolisin, activation domain-containing protein [Lactarius deliciosus]|nr:Pro-kumamolisin, activation domain-containing protein [Lactarius deliciosus]
MRCLQLSVLFHTIPPNWEALLPPWHDIRVKHTWNAVPRNWEALGHPPTGTTIDLHVALKPHGENALSDVLYKASDPRSPKYVLSNIPPRTTYLHGQVARPVAPHLDTLDLINSWLGHHAVPSSPISTTHSSSWLKLTGIPVSQANELLGASYQVYRRVGTNDISILRSVGYALPSILHARVQTRHSVGPELAVEDGGICASGNGSQRNLVEIMGYLQDYSSPDDLREFMTECRGDAEDVTFRVAPYSQAIAYLTPHTFYSTGGEVYIQNNELDSDDMIRRESSPAGVYNVLVQPVQRTRLRGTNVVFTSGNDSVGGGNCLAEDGSGRVEFIPEFPGSCPFVSTGGGTTSYPEVAAPLAGGSRTIFLGRSTRMLSFPPSWSSSAASITALTSALSAMAWHVLF